MQCTVEFVCCGLALRWTSIPCRGEYNTSYFAYAGLLYEIRHKHQLYGTLGLATLGKISFPQRFYQTTLIQC